MCHHPRAGGLGVGPAREDGASPVTSERAACRPHRIAHGVDRLVDRRAGGGGDGTAGDTRWSCSRWRYSAKRPPASPRIAPCASRETNRGSGRIGKARVRAIHARAGGLGVEAIPGMRRLAPLPRLISRGRLDLHNLQCVRSGIKLRRKRCEALGAAIARDHHRQAACAHGHLPQIACGLNPHNRKANSTPWHNAVRLIPCRE
jgi:hypothetical protein